MTNIFITFFAYIIDKFFGEFKFIRHPLMYVGDMVTFFEERYYKKNILHGVFLVLFMLLSIGFVSFTLQEFLSYFNSLFEIIISSFIASMFIAHRTLINSLKSVLTSSNKQHTMTMLIANDAQGMSESDIYKASIETYAKKLSDDVIAPLLYLLVFGLPGIIIYKTVNTMDSMVGYKTARYEKYGKATARLNDVFTYIPARLTAVLIMFAAKEKNLFAFYKDGKRYGSPNNGHPITAMALALGVKLGGSTWSLGKVKRKPVLGKGRKIITEDDLRNALDLLPK